MTASPVYIYRLVFQRPAQMMPDAIALRREEQKTHFGNRGRTATERLCNQPCNGKLDAQG